MIWWRTATLPAEAFFTFTMSSTALDVFFVSDASSTISGQTQRTHQETVGLTSSTFTQSADVTNNGTFKEGTSFVTQTATGSFTAAGSTTYNTGTYQITTTTTVTETFEAVGLSTTSSSEYMWQSSTTSFDSDTSSQITFVLGTTEATSLISAETESTRTQYSLTAQGIGDSTGGFFATVVQAQAGPADRFRPDDGSEYFLVLTQNFYASSWDGIGFPAEQYVSATDRWTFQPRISNSSVHTYVASSDSTTASFSDGYSLQFNLVEETVVDEAHTSSVDFDFLPNKSRLADLNYYNPAFSFTTVEPYGTLFSSVSASAITTITHYGNTASAKIWGEAATTATGIFGNGETFSELQPFYYPRVTSSNAAKILPAYELGAGQSAGGNTSYEEQDQLLALVATTVNSPADFPNNVPRVSVFKSFGAVVNGESGFSVTADNLPTETDEILSGSFFALHDRAMATSQYWKSINEVPVSIIYETNYFTQPQSWYGRGIFSLTEAENSSWTISENTITYTTTTIEEGDTVGTTDSGEIGVEGEMKFGLVAIKTVLGGYPEEGAFFSQWAPPGIYRNQVGDYVTIAGDVTQITGEPTSFIQAVPHVTFLSSAIFSGQLATISRNPVPRGAGDWRFGENASILF